MHHHIYYTYRKMHRHFQLPPGIGTALQSFSAMKMATLWERSIANAVFIHHSSPLNTMFQRILVLFLTLNYVNGFVHPISAGARYQDVRMNLADGDWIGEVVANNAGKIKGCAIQKVEGSLTEWTIQIDGWVKIRLACFVSLLSVVAHKKSNQINPSLFF